jgi:hypothetical protein
VENILLAQMLLLLAAPRTYCMKIDGEPVSVFSLPYSARCSSMLRSSVISSGDDPMCNEGGRPLWQSICSDKINW